MDWQCGLVLVIVAAAMGYIARQTWRTWTYRKTGCGGGCGCASAKPASANGSMPLIPTSDLHLRRRER
ncbi:MAG: FeoB-associated Cys-rich membrane protein [Gemmataceae bacterium]